MACIPRSLLYISLLLGPLLARADATVAGVPLAESYTLAGQSLLLNGAGVRSKVFVDVYVGALYAVRSHAANDLLTTPGPKSMQMHMLYEEVPAAKIARGWRDGFSANLDTTAFARLEQRLADFNAPFPDLRHGDMVRMDYEPAHGTRLSVNDKALGGIEGKDFFTGLMQVWIGEHPADAELKQGLLGQE